MATEFSSATFPTEVLKSARPVLVDFWAEWCGPCKMLTPVIEQLSKDYAGKVTVGKVNVDEYPDLASEYGITGIPAVLMFKNGQVVGRSTGFKPLPVMKQFVDANS